MQNLSTQDSIKTRQLLADRFWIIEQNGVRIGTIQRHDDNNFIVTGTDSSVATMTKKEIGSHFELFGKEIVEVVEIKTLLKKKYMDTKQNIFLTIQCLMSNTKYLYMPSRLIQITCMRLVITLCIFRKAG